MHGISSPTRLLITGGTGFFGRAILRYLIASGFGGDRQVLVNVLSRDPEIFLKKFPEFSKYPWITFSRGDILNPRSLSGLSYADWVLHAAADSDVSMFRFAKERFDQIVTGTENVLLAAKNIGAGRFLYVSSGAAYGPQPHDCEKITELYCGMPDPLELKNVYGVAKRVSEHLCALFAENSDIRPMIARCFAFVGIDLPLRSHFAIGNFIYDALWSKEIVIAGDGNVYRSYLDQGDLAAWLIAILERGVVGRVYNVGSDKEISILEVATLVRDIIAPKKHVVVRGASSVTGAGLRYVPSVERIQSELKVASTIDLRDSIINIAKFHESPRDWRCSSREQ